DDLEEAPYSGFGPFETARISVPGGVVDLAIAPGERDLPTSALTAWADTAGRAVAGYYGRYPVPRVLVLVLPTGRRAIGFGTRPATGAAPIGAARSSASSPMCRSARRPATAARSTTRCAGSTPPGGASSCAGRCAAPSTRGTARRAHTSCGTSTARWGRRR